MRRSSCRLRHIPGARRRGTRTRTRMRRSSWRLCHMPGARRRGTQTLMSSTSKVDRHRHLQRERSRWGSHRRLRNRQSTWRMRLRLLWPQLLARRLRKCTLLYRRAAYCRSRRWRWRWRWSWRTCRRRVLGTRPDRRWLLRRRTRKRWGLRHWARRRRGLRHLAHRARSDRDLLRAWGLRRLTLYHWGATCLRWWGGHDEPWSVYIASLRWTIEVCCKRRPVWAEHIGRGCSRPKP